MKYFLTISLYILSQLSYSQTDMRISFQDTNINLTEHKNSKGEIVNEPQPIKTILPAYEFDENFSFEDRYDKYLLLNSRKFQYDSTYFNCENEGYTCFQVNNLENRYVGMLDSNTRVVIPAEYDAIILPINGYVMALKGAKKRYSYKGSTHWNFERGTELLLDVNNNILIENFQYTDKLNFHSVKIEETPSKEKNRVSFKGVNNKYYTFIDNEKLFAEWFTQSFLKETSINELIKNSAKNITYRSNSLFPENSTQCIKKNAKHIQNFIAQLRDGSLTYKIYDYEMVLYSKEEYQNEFILYYNNCNRLIPSKYPIEVQVTDNYKNRKSLVFLKTNDGFKLITIELDNL